MLVAAGCLALLVGIGCAARFRWVWLAALSLVAPFAFLRFRRQDFVALIFIVIACFGLGSWRGQIYQAKVAAYEPLMKQSIVLRGIAQEDAVYGRHQQLTFVMGHLELHRPHAENLVGTVSVAGFGAPAVFRGDEVEVRGKLYPTLGANRAKISYAQLHVVAHHTSWVEDTRRSFAAGMQNALPEPAASFGLGLLLGQRNTLPAAVSQQLLMVGLVHIIAVSGYNLTIMLQVARKLFGERSKFQAAVAFVALIGTFLLFTGSSPSIVRAAIISLLSIFAWYYGRTIKPLTLILLAAAVTGMANPLYVWGNISWYLSFLAFSGVLLLAPLVIKRFFKGKQPGLLVAILIESLCAEVMTLPFILHIFGQLSLVSLLANVLVVALIPLGMLLALVAGLAGMLAPVWAGWIAWPAKYLLTYMLDVAHLLSRIPHVFVEHIGFSLSAMLFVYGIILFVGGTWWYKTRPKRATITDEIAAETEGV